MFFKKKDETIQEISIQSEQVKLEYVNDTIGKQLQMLNLSEDDLKYLKLFKPHVDDNIQEIVDSFYRNLGMEASLINIINDHSSVDRLKVTLRRHICEMFAGEIDEEYFVKRKKLHKFMFELA